MFDEPLFIEVNKLISATEGVTSSITDIFMKKPRMCKRKKKKMTCHTTKHGCCPDKVTPAAGPFDEGKIKSRNDIEFY